MSEDNMTARCACGQVVLRMRGAPIISIACYCDDCQAGARKIEALPGAAPVKSSDGGTSYLVYRKDRVECSSGQEHLQSLKIKPGSATNRVVAACCNSAMYVGFDDSKHWVDVYHSRVEGAVPPLQMRVCTRFKPMPDQDSTGIPGHPGYVRARGPTAGGAAGNVVSPLSSVAGIVRALVWSMQEPWAIPVLCICTALAPGVGRRVWGCGDLRRCTDNRSVPTTKRCSTGISFGAHCR